MPAASCCFCRVFVVHNHLAASRCASLLCPKCSQFAVKHDECGMSSLTTRLGTRCAPAKGCALPGNREEGHRGMQGAGCWVQALKSRWHWQKGWHCVRPHDQMIVSQSHILQPALCDQKLSHEQLEAGQGQQSGWGEEGLA